MKQKVNARQKRDAEALRRKEAFSAKPEKTSSAKQEKMSSATQEKEPVRNTFEKVKTPTPSKSPEEKAREFLEYLDRHDVPASKEDLPRIRGKKSLDSGAIPKINLEEGMPAVSEALKRMHAGLQEIRYSRPKAVKLIHGYGSTGRGGKIRIGVREELMEMKQRKQIRDFIPGEEFGPADPSSRELVDRDRRISRDPDYGRINHGITIVVL